MAIINFTNYRKGQTRPLMRLVMKYVQRGAKTEWEDRHLVTGINCRPESVYDDFMITKSLYHKTGGRLFFHMVQSFPKGEEVDPVTAHACALELAKWFQNYEVLVCTHTDRDHIHTHFLINSVNFETGQKLHVAEPELSELRQRNDMVCAMFNLPVFQSQQKRKKVKSMSGAEYHAAARGESWKFQLINAIDECMRCARTKDEFITLMEIEGYQVRWSDTRKNITYTTPNGLKCRDDRLHDERYLKEAMEHEFRIRTEILYGGIEEAEYESASDPCQNRVTEYTGDRTDTAPGADTSTAAHCGPVHDARCSGAAGTTAENAGADQQHTGESAAEDFREWESIPNMGTDAEDPRFTSEDHDSAGTGWEAEREALLAAQTASPQNYTSGSGLAGSHHGADDVGSLAHDLVVLGKELERFDEPAPLTPAPMHIDRKRWKELQKKKTALGHKPDDHEDKQAWQQKM